ncbi:hypothetical protein HA402_001307 [Bradysia odoriphaga]|nr:hypothetical protein HA402_001307 [Bradysia odoriphaga]
MHRHTMTIDGIKDLLRSHLNKKWNSAVTGLATQIFFVECGLRPGFIWDIGPPVDSQLIINVMSDLRRSKLISFDLRIVQIADDFCVVNVQSYCSIDFSDVTFVNVSSPLLEPRICNSVEVTTMVTSFGQQIKNLQNSDELFLEVRIDPSFCIPTLFGLVAGFPVVYYYDPSVSDQNCLANVLLSIHQVCHRNGTVLFSVSCPAKLIDETSGLRRNVERWTDSFRSDIDLVFKVFQETLSVVVL